jgi:FlaA1/EpsC-like NDP-sugar epimerase
VPRFGRLILRLTYQRRAVEFALDFLVISSAYYGAILIHHNFKLSWPTVAHFSHGLPAVCLAAYAAFLITGTYRHMWRYASLEAALRFGLAAALAGLLAAGVLAVVGLWIPAAMVVLFAMVLFNLLVGTRMSFRILKTVLNYFAAPERRVLVVGAGTIADSAARELMYERLSLVGFLDNDVFKHSKLVRGHPVLGAIPDIGRVYRETGFNEILIAQDQTADTDLKTLQSFASDMKLASIAIWLGLILCLVLTPKMVRRAMSYRAASPEATAGRKGRAASTRALSTRSPCAHERLFT